MPRRPSIGRDRIEIRRIQNEEARQLTFSKRRVGTFTKASELLVLCGAEVAIVVFSLAGKSFSFGHPSVNFVIDRFLTANDNRDNNPVASILEANRSVVVGDLNNQYNDTMAQIEANKRRGDKYWWESPIDQIGLEQLESLKNYMGSLNNQIVMRTNELLMNEAANIP